MRHILSRRIPPFTRVLLIESGARGVFDRLIPRLYEIHGGPAQNEPMELDLVTCHADTPAGFRGRLFRVQDYTSAAARRQLYRELNARRYSVVGILCSNQPIMTKWKWMLAVRLPAKILMINENADTVWLDWSHRQHIARLARVRLGFTGASAIPALSRVVLLPFAVIYLLLYAMVIHMRRLMHTRQRI